MCRRFLSLSLVVLLAGPVFGQPREWRDDFTAAATYDGNALLGPCYGATVSTKYTTLEPLTGDIFNQKGVSGGGKLRCSAANLDAGLGMGRIDGYAVGVVNIGQGCPDQIGVPYKWSSEPFTSDNLCIYVGWEWNNWQMWEGESDGAIYGVDGKPGFANLDDDEDGTTDEDDEYPGLGEDGAPGEAGVDDDGINGVDDIGETKFPGSDDSDDERGSTSRKVGMRLDILASGGIHTHFGPNKVSSPSGGFAIRELDVPEERTLERANELWNGFYEPYVHYNQMFCASGTCYGAIMWVETDMANPSETLGPLLNTLHDTSDAVSVYLVVSNTSADPDSIRSPYENATYMGNSNFDNAYWVISGDPTQYPYFPSIQADLDDDRDVDGNDFLTFSLCYNGSLKAPQPGCANLHADMDGDGDVDGFDFTTWSLCHNGSLRRPQASCMPPNLTNCP